MKEQILQAIKIIEEGLQRVLHGDVFSSLPSLSHNSRSLLDTPETIDQDYVMTLLTPLIVGIVIGALVFLAYLLFFLVSACCKCCKQDRGCCQRPQQNAYKQRIPFVAVVAAAAILGAIGGIVILSSGPKTVSIVDQFITDIAALVDSIFYTLQAILEDTARGLSKASITNDSIDDLQQASAELTQLREDDINGLQDAVDTLLRLVSTIAMAIGGVLMGVALLGLCGAALLQSWMLSSFIFLSFLLNWAAWVLFGALAFAGSVLSEVCIAIDEAAAGEASRLPEIDCMGIALSAQTAQQEIQSGIVSAIRVANWQISNATEDGNNLVNVMNVTCDEFNVGGSSHNNLCVSSAASVDAPLLSSIYNCVSPAGEDMSTFNINDALDDASPCTWHSSSYPIVDFGGNVTRNCFETATSLLNVVDYRGIVTAASRVGNTSLTEEYMMRLTSTIRLGCAYDLGANGVVSTFLTPPSIPELCSPYRQMEDYYVQTWPDSCMSAGTVPLSDLEAAYQDSVCTTVTPPNESSVAREACIIAGTPLFPSEFDDMKEKADAVVIFQNVIEMLNQFVSCEFMQDLLGVLQTHCHPLADSVKMLGTGSLLAGIGLMLTALFICSCWRKITRPVPGKIAPGEDTKLLQPHSP